jgi:hypothetical protein
MDRYELPRLRVWKRPKQNCIDHRKQGGVCTDPEGKSKKYSDSESGTLSYDPQAVTDVLK